MALAAFGVCAAQHLTSSRHSLFSPGQTVDKKAYPRELYFLRIVAVNLGRDPRYVELWHRQLFRFGVPARCVRWAGPPIA